MKKLLLLLLTLMILLPGMKAQDEVQAIEADSLLAENDSVMEDLYPDPEWYVAPIEATVALAPKRALAATSCPIDSVLTFDVDSNFVSVTTFEYDDQGRTICEIEWIYVDGVRVGKSKTEYGFNAAGTQVLTATYEWDGTAKDWKGIKKTEYVYNAQDKMESNTESDWVNGAWLPKTRYTYAYDPSKREIEYITYTRNSSNELVLSKGRYRDYNAAGKTILDIQYTAHNGTDWSAGTKEIWEFNGPSNKQNLHEKFSWSNSDWSITLREILGYDAANNNDLIENYALQSNVWKGTKKEKYEFDSNKKKTSSIVYAWSNGAWVNSTKEIWEFNGPSSKQTLHEKYSWTNNDWQITLQENTGFTGNNNTSVENYALQSNVWKGTKKEEYSYSGSTKIATITYTWSSNAWVYSVWTVSDKVNVPNESCRYVWTNDAWVGNGNRTLTTNNSSNKPIEVITQTWSTEVADWLNYTRKTTVYEGSKTIIQEATYNWSVEANDWVGATRSDWHYNAAGLNDTIKTYTNNGTDWLYTNRTVNTYDAKKNKILVHNAKWETEKWVMTTMEKLDILYDEKFPNLVTLNATYSCGADSIWKGIAKDTAAYLTADKPLYKGKFTSWANNDWVPSYKVNYVYDEKNREILNERYDWVNKQWEGAYRYETEYDSEGRKIMYAYLNDWNSLTESWIGSYKEEYVYNANGEYDKLTRYNWKDNQWSSQFLYSYVYDASKREIEQVVQVSSSGSWTNVKKYTKEYKGSDLVKNNELSWINNQWMFSSRNELYYDKDAQAKLRREIKGSWSNGVVSSFTDKHYFYACDPKLTFIIRFVNYDGTLLESKQVNTGEIPAYSGAEPSKPNNAQYTYSFKGWKPAIAKVTEAATYTADFDSVVNKYTITFNNYDGSPLQSGDLAYGATPAYTGDTPVKPANAQYTYTFKGWKPAIAEVTEAATYTADFDSVVNNYTIAFVNYDGSPLQSGDVAYGATPAYTGETPAKPANAQYTYTFKGWKPAIADVTEAATYTADYDSVVNNYTIIFNNYDGSPLQSSDLAYGATPSYSGETPVKPANAQYTYTFKGWKPAIADVTEAATYTADFDSVVNAYTIAFVNYDGSPLQSNDLAYGATPAYSGETPAKPANAQYTYTFKGWKPAIADVTEAATYTADFDSTVNVYTITFYFEDGVVVLDEVEVPYGEMPVCTLIPTKQSDSQYSYTFAGWDPELVPVTGEAGYKAVYDATPIIPTALPETDGAVKATKVMINGRFFILREGHTYTLDGVLVE